MKSYLIHELKWFFISFQIYLLCFPPPIVSILLNQCQRSGMCVLDSVETSGLILWSVF